MAEDFAVFTGEFTNKSDCKDTKTLGLMSTRYDYIAKGLTGDSGYPEEACPLTLHYNFRAGNIAVDANVTAQGIMRSNIGDFNSIKAGSAVIPKITGVCSGNKVSFDIPHVKDSNKRIRHIVAEGPEPGIYIRGRLTGSNVIELPEYWDGLIDPATITVTLTQIKTSQDLIVDSVPWGKSVVVKSGNSTGIDCFYEVWAARWLDVNNHDDKLHVVYDGKCYDDYPGDNDVFWRLNDVKKPQGDIEL